MSSCQLLLLITPATVLSKVQVRRYVGRVSWPRCPPAICTLKHDTQDANKQASAHHIIVNHLDLIRSGCT